MRTLKCIILITLIGMSQRLFAQVRFETALNWEQAKQKAETEGKLIFIDVYATYCKPCKEMDNLVFSSSKVGSFFNKHFVNLKVQGDETKRDNANIVSWRPVANQLKNKYKVDLYPTYLFFNQRGVLIHEIKGSDLAADSFIEKCKPALDQNTQLMTLKMQYEKGDQDSLLILSMNKLEHGAGIKPMFDSTPSALTNKPDASYIKLLFNNIDDNKDKIKQLCIKYPQLVDSLNGRGVAAQTLRDIVIYNEIYPMFSAGQPIKADGPMVMIPKLAIKEINKDMVLGYVESAYPGHGKEFLLGAEQYFYDSKGDKKKSLLSYLDLVRSFPLRVSLENIVILSFQFLNYDMNDKAANDSVISIAKTWISEFPEQTGLWYPTSMLMYKDGDAKSAITMMERFQKKLNSEDQKTEIQKIIDKMKSGETI